MTVLMLSERQKTAKVSVRGAVGCEDTAWRNGLLHQRGHGEGLKAGVAPQDSEELAHGRNRT
jgi:hypothetical protein